MRRWYQIAKYSRSTKNSPGRASWGFGGGPQGTPPTRQNPCDQVTTAKDYATRKDPARPQRAADAYQPRVAGGEHSSPPNRLTGSAACLVSVLVFGGCGGSEDSSSTTAPTKEKSPPVNWVRMGFDLQSTFHNTRETKLTKANVKNLAPAWANPPKIQVYGTPIVVGNTVYVGGSDGVYAVNASDGSQIWKFSDGHAASGTSSALAYENGILYMNTGSGGWALALDVHGDTPTLKWEKQYDTYPNVTGFSSAIVVDDLVVFGDSSVDNKLDTTNGPFQGAVVALHKDTGRLAWKTPTTVTDGEDGCSVWGTVAIDPVEKIVYTPVGNNYNTAGEGSDSILALGLVDGSRKWQKRVSTGEDIFNLTDLGPGPDSDFGANPVVFDYGGKKLVAAGQKSGDLFVWDRIAGGEPLKSVDLGEGTMYIGGVLQGLAFDGKHLITVCNQTTSTAGNPKDEPKNGDSTVDPGTAVLYALDPLTLDTVYARQLGAWVWSPITIANGVGFLGEETTLEAFDVDTGDPLFTFKTPTNGTIASGIAISNGRIFFGSGLTYLFGQPDGTFYSLALP